MELLAGLRRMHAIPIFDATVLFGVPFLVAILLGAPADYLWSWHSFLTFVAVFGSCTLLRLHLSGAHKIFFQHFGGSDLMNLLGALGLGFSMAFIAGYLVGGADDILQRISVVAFIGSTTVLLLSRFAARTLRRAFSNDWTSSWSPSNNILVIGSNPLAAAYVTASREVPSSARIVGVVANDPAHAGRVLRGIQILGTIEKFGPIVETFRNHGIEINRVVMTVPPSSLATETREEFNHAIEANGIAVETLSNSFCFSEPQVPATQDSFATAIGSYPGKRLLDFTVASLGLLIFAPLLALGALLVLLDVGRPIIFWQERPGRFGVPFRLYKLRTMKSSVGLAGDALSPDDAVTALGHFLRKSRLDELPQLLNVLSGEMSLVGPRPLMPRDQPASGEERLRLRPGITGWAQVSGGKFISPEQKLELDLWYAENCSFALDLEILKRTLATIFHGDLDQPVAIGSYSQREKSTSEQVQGRRGDTVTLPSPSLAPARSARRSDRSSQTGRESISSDEASVVPG